MVGGPNGDLSPANISSTYSPVKTIVSIVQLIFAISTIYRSRGDQIDRFGYAAFGLTVIQYAIMSFINLVANMTCPQYSHLYMVETELMRNLRANSDAHFQGVVGILQEDADDVSGEENLAEKRYGRRRYIRLAWLPVGLLPTVLTLLIILGLTKFQPGSDSTETQLAASQIWLMFGGAVASMPDLRYTLSEEDGQNMTRKITIYRLKRVEILIEICHLGMGGAIIWCVYVSMKMLWDYGSCTLI